MIPVAAYVPVCPKCWQAGVSMVVEHVHASELIEYGDDRKHGLIDAYEVWKPRCFECQRCYQRSPLEEVHWAELSQFNVTTALNILMSQPPVLYERQYRPLAERDDRTLLHKVLHWLGHRLWMIGLGKG